MLNVDQLRRHPQLLKQLDLLNPVNKKKDICIFNMIDKKFLNKSTKYMSYECITKQTKVSLKSIEI
jgi:hypothetical protein